MRARPDASPSTRRGASRWGRRSTLSEAHAAALRLEVVPPALGGERGGLWQRLALWLMAPAPHEVAPRGRLHPVRDEFLTTLADLHGEGVAQLRDRIEQAASLRELWHLRTEVYRVVGVALSQAQAEARLVSINQHFAGRAAAARLAAP